MYASTEKLLHAAEVLEKVAYVFEDQERQEQEKKAAQLKSEFLDPIKDVLPAGNSALAEKLASADPEILSLIKSLSGVSGDDSTSYALGGPTEKIASEVHSEDPLLAFCMDED